MKEKLESLSIPDLDCSLEPPICRVLGRCSTVSKHLKPISFVFGDKWQYNVDVKDMVDDVVFEQKDYCELALRSNEDRSTIEFGLGIPFLKSFYTELDFDDYNVGFAVSIDSASSISLAAEQSSGSIFWIVVSILAFIGVCIGGWYLWHLYHKQKL